MVFQKGACFLINKVITAFNTHLKKGVFIFAPLINFNQCAYSASLFLVRYLW